MDTGRAKESRRAGAAEYGKHLFLV